MAGLAGTVSEFYRKVSRVRTKLRAWNREVFGHIGMGVVELEKVTHTTELRYDMERSVASKIAYHEARAAYMYKWRLIVSAGAKSRG